MDLMPNCGVGAAGASSTLELAAIGGAKAERLLIAAIWRILEAHSLASPIIEVNSVNGLFDISVTFGSAKDCATGREQSSK
jgi:hypothetical protein